MTTNPETLFKQKVKEDLKSLLERGLIWYFKSQEVSTRGIPDIIMCVDSIFIALELKVVKTNRKDEVLQKAILRKIEKAKGRAFFVYPDTWPSILEHITKLAEQRQQ